MKKTLIIGASTNEERYSYKCIVLLQQLNIECVAIGNRKGSINNLEIHTEPIALENIDTVCIYIGAKHQANYYKYILSIKPKRILFPPGTENEDFENMAKQEGIYTERACPLVMLKTNSY